MKKTLLLSLILCIPFVFAQIEIKNTVNDYAEILTGYESQITEVADSFKDQVQFAVVTVNSLDGKDIESYSYNLAQGHLGDTQKNNGLLLLISLNDRQYRFEVGRNIESTFNDAKVGRIGRMYLVPNFKNSEYGKGVLEATIAVKNILNGTDTDSVISEYDWETIQILVAIIFVVFVIFAAIMSNYAKKDRYFKAAKNSRTVFGPVWGQGGLKGGGGFGGGSFGGGGASGGW